MANSDTVLEQFEVVSSPGGADFALTSFAGTEELSGLFQFQLQVTSAQDSLSFSSILGQNFCLAIHLPSSDKQYLHGVITSLAQLDKGLGATAYRIQLEPWFALLRMKTDYRVFQNQSVPDIVTSIFTELGMANYRNDLQGSYSPREYCVQYGESCFDFISRLLESEGIFYFFEHSESAHTLVLADSHDSFLAIPGIPQLRYQQTGHSWGSIDVLQHSELGKQLTPGKYLSDDYNFEVPSTDLLTTVEGSLPKWSIYEYPGEYLKKDQGDTIANLRLTALEAQSAFLRGESKCSGFHCGCKFTLQQHYRSDANVDYILRSVSHHGDNGTYSNSFEAFPASLTHRPARRTPRPVVYGLQSALVVGKEGEEIWTDEYGRVKVQFYWDQLGEQDENSSCWIRVAQPWSGKQWGGFALPRLGQEVLVAFLDGNPDRPVVVGSLYNAEQVVPYALPANQTRTTTKSQSSKDAEGYNEILFEDKAGSEQLQIHAQKDMDINVLNNYTQTVTKDYTLTVQGNLKIDVTGTISIASKDASTLESSAAATLKSGTEMNIQSGTALAVKSGTSLAAQAGTSLAIEAATALSAKGTASTTVESSGTLELKGALAKIN